MRISILSLVLLALPAAELAAQTEPFVTRAQPGSCVVVRERPEPDAPRRDCLAPGVRVDAVAAIPFWREVVLADSTHAWIAKRYLAPVDSAVTTEAPPANPWLVVHLIDVGQGDAILIQTPDDNRPGNGRYEGRNILIDAGPPTGSGDRPLVRYLEDHAHHGALLDALLVTHPHDDHYAGAGDVLEHFEVARYYDAGFNLPRLEYDRLVAGPVATETVEGRPIRIMRGGAAFDAADWGSELGVELLWSYPGVGTGLGTGGSLVNNASLVIKLTYGSVSFLFTGDLEAKSRGADAATARLGEARLLEHPERLGATVLKLAHHGSETSSTEPFLRAVQPRIVILSSGRRSYSGTFLPDATVLERVCRLFPGAEIYRTDHRDAEEGRTAANDADGDDVVVRTDGRVVQVQAFSAGHALPRQTC